MAFTTCIWPIAVTNKGYIYIERERNKIKNKIKISLLSSNLNFDDE
jgi:hypothetical protein